MLDDGKSPQTGKQVIPAEALAKISSAISVTAPGSPTVPELSQSVYGMGFAPGSYQGHQVRTVLLSSEMMRTHLLCSSSSTAARYPDSIPR